MANVHNIRFRFVTPPPTQPPALLNYVCFFPHLFGLKVACTQFNNLFNEITGGRPVYLDWPWYRNSPKVVGWSKQQLEDAIVDPAWHKAIFYREPMERFLSGYRSKCERRHDKDGANHCKKYFGRKRIAFETAVDAVASVDRKMSHAEQLAESFDVHWTRQSKYCGGLDRSLQYYDTVVRVDKNTAREEVRTMLNKSGIDASRLTKFDKLFPEGKAGNTGKNKGHVTASDAHMLEYFKTFQLTNIIKQHYVEDYRVFGIQAPSWAVDEEAFLEHQRAPQESSSRPG